MIPRAVRLAVWGIGATLVVLALGAAAAAVPVSLALGASGLALLIFAAWLTHRARRAAEEALRRSEEQFRRAIVDAPIPILMHAEDGEVLVLSHAWTRLSGYSREDIPTMSHWLEQAYGPAARQVEERIRRAFEGGTGGSETELVIRTRDGESRVWTFTAGEPGRLPDGRLFLVTMATDVTERRQAE